MQKSSAPFFFSFRRFLFCTLVEVRYWPKENVITSSVGGARLLQDAHADEIGASDTAWAFAAGQYASHGPRSGRRRRACVGSRLHEYV